MYRYQRRHAPWQNFRRKAFVVVAVILLLVAVATGWYIESHSGTTIIHNPVAKTTYVTTANTPVQTFSETDFTIQLPTDWKFIGQTTGPYNFYTWQDTTKYEDNRILDLYVDTIPGTAVSRLQPVSADGNRLQIGTMSDVCLTFTGAPASSAQTAQSLPNQLAKWQGINFMCDLSNYNNNSVGTSSLQGINTVTLTGSTTGRHSFFFLYVDHNIQPDYSIFTNALKSFRVK
jgi:hypothetical protein